MDKNKSASATDLNEARDAKNFRRSVQHELEKAESVTDSIDGIATGMRSLSAELKQDIADMDDLLEEGRQLRCRLIAACATESEPIQP